MGNVRKHRKWWQLVYQVGGQRHWETVHVESRSEAIRVLKMREGKALDPQKPPELPQPVTFEDLAADLEQDYRTTGKRCPATLAARLRNLRRHFRGRSMASITTTAIRQYADQRLSEDAAPSTVNAELAKLKRIFNLALRSERLYHKPYIPMLRESSPRQGFFETGQFQGLVAKLPANLRPIAEFAYHTGWRRSEITSLTWDQVDLEARVLRLWPGETKNQEGRVLPLEGELWRLLQEQARQRLPGCPWVFHRRGRRILTFYKAWKEACEKAGCPGMLFHDLRRTAARNFRRAGLSENEAMKITGHKTPSIFRRYSIIAEEDLRNAVRASEAFLSVSLENGKECAQSVPKAGMLGGAF